MNDNLLASILDRIGALLDVPLADQERAIARYDDLAAWLAANEPGRADVHVYPQGSFRLGTVVRPAELSKDFDIDLVFLRDLARTSVTQDELRRRAGELLVRYCIDRDLSPPVELGRCWRLELFDDGFHLDVLPVIPDEDLEDGILLSDRDFRLWLESNPIGYADWFYNRMNQLLVETKRVALAKELGRDVDDVPRFFVRTPLQRTVQLLKHSRDVYFADDCTDAPPSILLTTLAARAYRGQASLDEAFNGVIATMDDHIECRNGVWWVENPAHDGENFADKWNTAPERREAFYAWLGHVQTAVQSTVGSAAVERVGEQLTAAFGPTATDAVEAIKGAGGATGRRAATGETRGPREQFIEEVVGRVAITEHLEIACEVKEKAQPNRYHRRRAERRRRLQKEESLRFSIVSTSVPGEFDVYWKVRNFGRDALVARSLRGEIVRDEGKHERIETTRYRGEHYVECYIVKDGCCVARAREWVPIG